MITMNDIQVGDTLFHLDRNSPDVNNPEFLAVEMTIKENDDGIYAHGKQGYFTISYGLTDKSLYQITNGTRPTLFRTREEALAQNEKEVHHEVNTILNTSASDILQDFYSQWVGEHMSDYRIYEAMKKRVRELFAVDVI